MMSKTNVPSREFCLEALDRYIDVYLKERGDGDPHQQFAESLFISRQEAKEISHILPYILKDVPLFKMLGVERSAVRLAATFILKEHSDIFPTRESVYEYLYGGGPTCSH